MKQDIESSRETGGGGRAGASAYQTVVSVDERQSLENLESVGGKLLADVLRQQKEYFESGATRSYAFRVEQLERLRRAIKKYEPRIMEAGFQDLRKNQAETFLTEIGFLYNEIRDTKRHLKDWMRDEKVATPLLLMPARSRIISEPLGQVLIISPWNYPFQLLMSPVISAIAAGNTLVLKPSEVAPQMARVIADLVRETFEERYVACFCGGVAVSQGLLEFAWDHIFFTGSTAVGKVVAAAAAKHLSPVTLELGGKSPAIVDESADIKIAARRIAWGKFINAGQTCIAPDYVLVAESRREELVAALAEVVREFYGDHPQHSTEFGRIINERHFDRLQRLLDSGRAAVGGDCDRRDLYIAPTVLVEVSLEAPVMQEEIFGPILPVLSYQRTEDACKMIRRLPRPLALYLFSEDDANIATLTRDLSFGGGAVNDTVMHFLNAEMPFGGVGLSGLGSCHGKFGFDRFSHKKSLLLNTSKIDLPARYPPFSNWKNKLMRLLMDR